jgi:hypothetical protein
MVLSLLAQTKVPASKQCGFDFIPEIGLNAGNFSRSLWLASWRY